MVTLQWGHGESAVENTNDPDIDLGKSPNASMGPRRIRRGKPGRTLGRLGAFAGFNGATGNPAGKTQCERMVSGASVAGLQWGHGESAVENIQHRRHALPSIHASMGPRRIRRGKRNSRLDLLAKHRQASM